MITKKLREEGTMLGVINSLGLGEEPDVKRIKDALQSLEDPNKTDLVAEVTAKSKQVLGQGGRPRIAIYDLGTKRSFINSLLNRGAEVVVLPRNMKAKEVLDDKVNAIVISNGPGDPKMNTGLLESVATLAFEGIPVMGICLGNQIVALAMGADTYKMKFGHRGLNHPVTVLDDGKLLITSQNHGYAVENDSLDGTGLEVTQVHANDKTVEAMRHSKLPIITTQYHPEASPGPRDADWIFDEFLRMVKAHA